MKIIRVLLIEDNPEDVNLIRQYLKATDVEKYELKELETLAEARACLKQEQFDVIISDLSLPDGRGIGTVETVIAEASTIPIIFLTGLEDEEIALKSISAGAQDYLAKEQLSRNLMRRSIRYAVERHRLQTELKAARRQAERERELYSLNRLIKNGSTDVTPQAFRCGPLRESQSEQFATLVRRYEQVIDQAVEQLIFKTENEVSRELRSLAGEIGFLNGGPRDVVDIHRTALKSRLRDTTERKADVIAEEGRLLVLELMGDLVSFYRRKSWMDQGKPEA